MPEETRKPSFRFGFYNPSHMPQMLEVKQQLWLAQSSPQLELQLPQLLLKSGYCIEQGYKATMLDDHTKCMQIFNPIHSNML